MLLLLTIGLVLVALVALVIGFVTSALAPIYVSIACSVLAALVLFFFSRLSKREAPATVGAGPAPLPGPTVTGEASSASAVTVLGSAPATTEPAPADEADQAEPITEQVPAVAPAAEAEALPEGEEGLLADEAFAPEGWTPESDAPVDAHAEQPGTLAEIDEAGPAEVAAEAEPEPEAEPSPAALAESAEEAPGEREPEEDVIFPIAEYDDLRVSEILPLLPELDEDELQMVRDHEQQGRARFSILTRLDQLMAQFTSPASVAAANAALSQGFEEDITGVGEPVGAVVPAAPLTPPAPPEPPEPVAPPELDEVDVEPPEAVGIEVAATETSFAPPPAEPEPVAVEEPVPAEAEVARAFPIADYDGKKVTEILPLLTNMGADDLAQVEQYERQGKARGSVLARIEQLVARASDTAPPPTAVKKVTAKKAPAKKAAAAEAPAAKAAEAPAAKAAAAKKAATAKKIAAAKASGATTEKAAAKATKTPAKAAKTTTKDTSKDAAKAPAKKASPRTTKKQP